MSCKGCEECELVCSEGDGFVLENEDIGVEIKVTLNPDFYTDDEQNDIGMMVARVIDAWVKRRMMMLLNPGVYGITVQ
jgi:ferredoxin